MKLKKIIFYAVSILFLINSSTLYAAKLQNSDELMVKAINSVITGVVNIRTNDIKNTTRSSERSKSLDKYFEAFLLPKQETTNNTQAQSLGSGFFYKNLNFVVTNYHVIKDSSNIFVVTAPNRKSFSGSIFGFDKRTDVAVIKIDGIISGTPLSFGKSENLKLGESLFAIGNPFGYGHSVTKGILSAKDRSIGTGPFNDFLQTDAAINPGNSGGPLFNLKGEVVGINTAISAEGYGISFSIPAEIAQPVIDAIIEKGSVQRAWIGLLLSDLIEAPQKTPYFGVYVENVISNSPAQKAEILNNDVIISANDQPISGVQGFRKILTRIKPGEKLKLLITRQGQKPFTKLVKTAFEEKDNSENPTDF